MRYISKSKKDFDSVKTQCQLICQHKISHSQNARPPSATTLEVQTQHHLKFLVLQYTNISNHVQCVNRLLKTPVR